MRLKFTLILLTQFICVFGKQWKREHDDDSTLIQTHVLYSPGERTPRPIFTYPTDPYINETYYPFGPGELSLDGRKHAFELGEKLHERYANFLGSVYSPEIFESFATYYPWTQTSTQAVHAALFPPTKKYQISDSLKWQAIPYDFQKWEDDSLLCAYRACPLQFSLTEELERTPKYQHLMEEYEDLAEYATQNTGVPVNTTKLFEFLYSRLEAQELYGLKLPAWTEKIFPNPLHSAANLMWRIMAESPDIQRISSGAFLKKLIEDFDAKAANKSTKKMALYSTVSFTFIPLRGALGIYDGNGYSFYSHLMFELHKINGNYGVKTYFQDGSSKKPKLMKILNCGEFCPLEQFKTLVKDFLPRENWCSV